MSLFLNVECQETLESRRVQRGLNLQEDVQVALDMGVSAILVLVGLGGPIWQAV